MEEISNYWYDSHPNKRKEEDKGRLDKDKLEQEMV